MTYLFEGRFAGCKGHQLFYRVQSAPNPQANILLTHGQAEHSGCYQRVFAALRDVPVNLIAWDLRGHGQSQGQRGYVENFEDYCTDLDLMIAEVSRINAKSPLPLILFGHSMGGLITLKTMLQTTHENVEHVILSAPMLGLSIEVPVFKEQLAKLSYRIFPKLTLWNEIRFEQLTRDPDVIQEYTRDVFRHDRISSGCFLGSLEAIDFVFARSQQYQTPMTLMVSDSDPVVSTSSVEKLFQSLRCEKKLLVYPKRRHEIFNDTQREAPLADLKKEIETILSRIHLAPAAAES